VGRASKACAEVASHYEGFVLEVQGSTIHVGISADVKKQVAFVAELHATLRELFPRDHSRVNWWCMTVDVGRTLIVSHQGVHGDTSDVCLGRCANDPAKHLYSQLDIRLTDRDLKPFHVGFHDAATKKWRHVDLESTHVESPVAKSIAKEARSFEPKVHYINAVEDQRSVTAKAVPIGPQGRPSSPLPERPYTYFGWVMRVDLDGFSARVEGCKDDRELILLGQEFIAIMDAAADFVRLHRETLAQLPWAGDNFTAAAVFISKDDYDDAIATRLIDLSIDFELAMDAAADGAGFGGWAHGVAGGITHGRSGGNVYIAGVDVGDRRFLIGVGEGFGRSTQAFADVDPNPQQIVVYRPDWERLNPDYKKQFSPVTTWRNQTSELYVIADVDDLKIERGERATRTKTIAYTASSGAQEQVRVKPHYQ